MYIEAITRAALIHILYTTGLIAGVVVTLLVVVLLPLLVGAVLAVVVGVRRRNRKRKEKQNAKAAESYRMYKNKENLQGKGAPDGSETKHTRDEDHKPADPDQPTLSSGHYALAYAFINPASVSTEFGTDMYNTAHYSEVDAVQSDTQRERVFEQPSSGGKWDHYEEPLFGVKKRECIESEYAELDTSTERKEKEDVNKHEEEIVLACPEHFYATPDVAMKKNRRNQQQQEQEGVSEESNAAPPPPPPYKKVLQEREEEVDVVP